MFDDIQQDPQVVKRIIEENLKRIVDRGLVIAVRDRFLDVQLDGSKKLIRNVVLPRHIEEVRAGWWVAVVKLPRTTNWIALATLEDVAGGLRPTIANLPQPADVTATAGPYFIELSWSGSFRLEVTYEIQHNSSASETGATLIKWEGSNYIYWCVPGTQRYFRVRAVSEEFERSSWSAWVNATATTGVEDMFLALDASLDPEWVAFVWSEVAAVAGASVVHDHLSDAEGGIEVHLMAQIFGRRG
jgi:hypothetical protein